MRLLLVYPCADRQPSLWMPLGLAFIAARLRQAGHTVAIFDRHAAQYAPGSDPRHVDAALLDEIDRFRPDLVGLSTLSPLIHDTVATAALIRPAFDGLMLAGGYHATALPELTLQKIPALDLVLAGEGEEALARLADGVPASAIPGVWRRDDDRIVPPAAPPEQVADLDGLPQPALDLMDMAFYTQRSNGVIRGHNLKAATLVTSRGCFHRCDFCAESLTYGRGVRWHGVAYVLEWIERVVRNYGADGIHFHDNDFLGNPARTEAFCHALLQRGLHRRIRWSIQARADRITAEVAALLKRAGCVLVEIGVETATQAELDRVHKQTTVETTSEAVRICRRAGLDVHAYMLTALEGETIADLEQRLAWLKRHPVTSFQWSYLNIHPGTPLYRRQGNDFFVRSEWTAEAVAHYYATDRVSAIPPDVRRAWMRRHFAPFARRHWWMNAVGRYPLASLLQLGWSKVRRRASRLPLVRRLAHSA